MSHLVPLVLLAALAVPEPARPMRDVIIELPTETVVSRCRTIGGLMTTVQNRPVCLRIEKSKGVCTLLVTPKLFAFTPFRDLSLAEAMRMCRGQEGSAIPRDDNRRPVAAPQPAETYTKV